MTQAFVPQRLTPIVGRDASKIDEDALTRLAGLPEGETLDFKQELFWKTPTDRNVRHEKRRKLAKTIAAFANRSGGLLVLGIAEPKGGTGSGTLTPLQGINPDTEQLDLNTAVVNFCAPVPDFEVIPVKCTNGIVLLVSIPPSPRRPHAVVENKQLVYPIRDGNGNRDLEESEIADLYRNRFETADQQVGILGVRHTEFRDRLPTEDRAWLTVSLHPSREGHTEFSTARADDLREEFRHRIIGFPTWHGEPTSARAGAGLRSYRLTDDGYERLTPSLMTAQVHLDGGGNVGLGWAHRGSMQNLQAVKADELLENGGDITKIVDDRPIRVFDYQLVAELVNAVWFLGWWAGEECGAGDDALLVADLTPCGHGTALYQLGGNGWEHHIEPTPTLTATSPRAETMAAVNDIGTPGTPLLQVVRSLAQDLLAGAFEHIGPTQINPDGQLVPARFSVDRQHVEQWAKQHELETA